MEQEQETSFIDASSCFASPDVLRFINFLRMRLSWDQQAELALALDLCLECGGNLRRLNGEVVCERCGLVWHEEDSEQRIPFPEFEDASENGHYEAHWNPGSSLAFSRGLGTSMDNRSLAQILIRSEKSKIIMPTRLLTVKAKSNNHEPAQLMKLLARISFLLDKHGMRRNHNAAEYAGRLMRRIYLIAQAEGIRLPLSMADAVTLYTLRMFRIKNYDIKTLNLRKRDIAIVKAYCHIMSLLSKTYKF